MKILITGANGYLGHGIVKTALNKGHQIVATDFSVDEVDERAEKIECDLFKVEQPYVFFKRPDALLHLAWRDGFVHYADTHIVDLPSHYEFIKKITESEIGQVSIMGSMHEIGFFEGSIKEDTPCNPVTPYGISKNALRELSRVLCKRNSKIWKWLRGYYIVGTSLDGSSIFSKIASSAQGGQKEFPFTMGLNQFDFIDYEDFCEMVVSAISQKAVNGIINICSGKPEKLSDRVERFIADNGYDIKLLFGAFPERSYDSKAVWGDDNKIRKILRIERQLCI